MIPAREALIRLRRGNLAFARRVHRHDIHIHTAGPGELVRGQAPIAIVLGCSDSRAPAELIFNQGLGDLFVIRVAGNIVAPSQIGSIEFAAERFGVRLVVVMGHTGCGAVAATLDELERPEEARSPFLSSIVGRIRPAVEPLLETDPGRDRKALLREAVRANIRASVRHLKEGSEILRDLVATGGLWVVGAEYSLETGLVDFFEGVPECDLLVDDLRGANALSDEDPRR